MKQFEGKVVLVTGGSRNTGLEIVDRFPREGAKVFFCGTTAESVEKGAAELKRRGLSDFTPIVCDVGNLGQVTAMMDVIEREAGRLDVVVSNAANMGIARHLLFAVGLCRGEFIVPTAGDDISLPHRVSTLV